MEKGGEIAMLECGLIGAGKMAQWLGTPAARPEDVSLMPTPTEYLTTA